MKMSDEIKLDSGLFQGQLLFNEPLANYTTWRVGGLARKMYKPVSIADLASFIKQLSKDEALLWLGLGSNSLIRDEGFNGVVVLTQGCLKEISIMGDGRVRAEAGVSCATMARFCARANLAGGEFWAGIPGTMGGALRMNAGCSGRETWQTIVEVETMTRDGEIRVRKAEEFEIAYRHVAGLGEQEWFVAATCQLQTGSKESSLQLIKELLAHRANTQPTNEYNCGSVFRNPPGTYAARLIESCNLKGKQLGGAVVSEKHANFIINKGIASACDIEALIELVRDTVFKATNIELIREVHIIGDL